MLRAKPKAKPCQFDSTVGSLFISCLKRVIASLFCSLLSNSNPFSKLFPIPLEGLGLNPILQDPALAIHPPLLYVGFVGSSIYFSAALAALISKIDSQSLAISIKPWVLVSWFFQTVGILVGSIWAYYELGWGGYWFWDPVENSSLMPWFVMTALLHSILVLERKIGLYSWVIILSILTFTMSVTGTFLVRSGILNSVHTFANDPERGLYILTFLMILIFIFIFIFFIFYKPQNQNSTPISPPPVRSGSSTYSAPGHMRFLLRPATPE